MFPAPGRRPDAPSALRTCSPRAHEKCSSRHDVGTRGPGRRQSLPRVLRGGMGSGEEGRLGTSDQCPVLPSLWFVRNCDGCLGRFSRLLSDGSL